MNTRLKCRAMVLLCYDFILSDEIMTKSEIRREKREERREKREERREKRRKDF